MRILHISSAKTFGGGEKHLVDLCRGLFEAGHDVFVAIRPTCEWKEMFSFLPSENVFNVSIRNSFGLLSSKKISKFVKANNIEIIHAHLGRDYITASIVARLVSPLRCVLTRHVLFQLKTFNKFILTNVDRVIAVSEDVRLSLAGVFENRKVSVIYNGSPSSPKTESERMMQRRLVREKFRFDDAQLLIGVIGTISEIKGQDIAVGTLGALPDTEKTTLLIIGKGEAPKTAFEDELIKAAGLIGNNKEIRLIDYSEDIESLVCGLDVVLSPSRSESFGLVMLEALFAGVPVVATPTRGASLLLDQGQCGYIAKDFSSVALAEALKECLGDVKGRAEKLSRAKNRAAEFFTLERMVEKTESVYQELIKT